MDIPGRNDGIYGCSGIDDSLRKAVFLRNKKPGERAFYSAGICGIF